MIEKHHNIAKLPSYISSYQHEDFKALARLFENAFSIPLSEDLWLWKMDNLEGSGSILWNDETAIAFYGGIPRKLYYQGCLINGLQMRDVMVDPKWRGLLRKKGAFWQVATHYLYANIGQNKDFSVGFGFPNDKAAKLGQKLELYESTDQVLELTWKQRPALSLFIKYIYSVSLTDLPSTQLVDELWNQMHQSLKNYVVAVRNSEYVNLRYINHPIHNYQFFVIKNLLARPVGLIIANLNNNNNSAEIVDIIASTKNVNLTMSLFLNYLFDKKFDLVTAWFSPLIVSFIDFQPTSQQHIAHIQIGPPDTKVVQKAEWWATAGDTDFR